MTTAEALSGLAAIVGPVGVAGVLVAYFGYKQQASKGRPDASVPPASVSVTSVSAKDVELLSNAVTQVHSALTRLGLLWEFHFVEKTDRHDEFRDWSERRIIQDEIAALKAQRRDQPR